jgi:hypothetical protein
MLQKGRSQRLQARWHAGLLTPLPSDRQAMRHFAAGMHYATIATVPLHTSLFSTQALLSAM